MRERILQYVLCCSLLLIFAACDSNVAKLADQKSTIRVMTFNIEWGGEHVSFDNVVETIRRSNADIVGIQEAEGNLERLADALGWHYDRRNYVISKYPILEPPNANGRYVFVEVSPGRIVAHANLHLPSDPYGPDLVRDGADLAAVLANEEAVRVPALAPYLAMLPELADSGIPVIVTGDFNSPAFTDWTATLVGKRPFLRYPVEWPVSLAMAEAGFHDTWRQVFPDPEANPGLTWWAGRPPLEAYAPGENDAEDRIDYLWYAGPVEPQSAFIAGEVGGPELSLEISPWPSDHRAVYADFDVAPLAMPDLITTDRRVYTSGSDVRIRSKISSPGNAIVSVVDRQSNERVFHENVDGAYVELKLSAPMPGEYVVSTSTQRETLTRTFWVLPVNAEPELAVERTNASVVLRWRNAPGNRNDYIALYDAEETDIVNGMLGYAYIDARPHGTIDVLDVPGPGLVTSRTYVARLIEDDGYAVLAESPPFALINY